MEHEARGHSLVHVQADNGAHIDTIGLIVVGIAFFWVLIAYMRVQGRYRRLLERVA